MFGGTVLEPPLPDLLAPWEVRDGLSLANRSLSGKERWSRMAL